MRDSRRGPLVAVAGIMVLSFDSMLVRLALQLLGQIGKQSGCYPSILLARLPV